MTDEAKRGEVREPTRATLVQWVVDHVRERKPAPGETIPCADVEALTGLEWKTEDLTFVLISAKPVLYRGSPPYEWRVTNQGLVILSDAERAGELKRRGRQSRSLNREIIASAATIDRAKLTANEVRALEHAERMALHLYEQSKKMARPRFIEGKADAQIAADKETE